MGCKKVIGLDFGTLSARAILVSAEDGTLCGEAVFPYPHGVITGALPDGTPLPREYALAHAADYREALGACIREVMCRSGTAPDEIGGIGMAATTYTMVPCLADGTALCERPEFADEPMAYIKLWKHLGAQDQAARIQELHRQTGGFPAVERYGGTVNCEWALPKVLETWERSPALFARADRICDLGEWLTWLLVGQPVHSQYSMGFKCMWTPESGYPADQVLDQLSPGFAAALHEKFMGPPSGYDRACGVLSPQAAAWLGLSAGIPVATPMGDGSAPGICIGVNAPDSIAISLGTSIGMAFLRRELTVLRGINGVVRDGIVPGYYGYDAGQPCAGDMLDWFVTWQVPASYRDAAATQGCSLHAYLSALTEAKAPWAQPLTVLDWWSGNRGILGNMALRGAVCGYSMDTRPEDLYGAMVQGLACGSRRIIDHCGAHGIAFDRVVLCGGIPAKNPFITQQYASILGREVTVVGKSQVTARSAAILAAVAGGTALQDAAARIAPRQMTTVRPDLEHRADYEALYQRWRAFHDRMADLAE